MKSFSVVAIVVVAYLAVENANAYVSDSPELKTVSKSDLELEPELHEFQMTKLNHIEASPAKIGCEKMRKDAERVYKDHVKKNKAAAIIIPKCTPSGDFAPLQCYEDSRSEEKKNQTKNTPQFCQCWDKESLPYTAPSHLLRHCGCMRKRSSQLKEAGFRDIDVPKKIDLASCEPSGLFTPVQCDDNNCRCVDPITGVKIGGSDDADCAKLIDTSAR